MGRLARRHGAEAFREALYAAVEHAVFRHEYIDFLLARLQRQGGPVSAAARQR